MSITVKASVRKDFALALKGFKEDDKDMLRESGAKITKFSTDYKVNGSLSQLQDFAYRLTLLSLHPNTSTSYKKGKPSSAASSCRPKTPKSSTYLEGKQDFEKVFETFTVEVTTSSGSSTHKRVLARLRKVDISSCKESSGSFQFTTNFDTLTDIDADLNKRGTKCQQKVSAIRYASSPSVVGLVLGVDTRKKPGPSIASLNTSTVKARAREKKKLMQGNIRPSHVPSATDIDITECLQSLRFHQTNDVGVEISCSFGDITREYVDVIVNASNKLLKHDGGVSKALVKAGGNTIQTESGQLIKSRGPLSVGKLCHTNAGTLHCNHIIHAVGPKWKKGNITAKKILHNLLLDILEYASYTLGARSLAIPPISAGTNGMPDDVCAREFRSAVEEFCASKSSKMTLRDIRILTLDKDTARAFIREFYHSSRRVSFSASDPSLVNDNSSFPMKAPGRSVNQPNNDQYNYHASKSHQRHYPTSDTTSDLGAVGGSWFSSGDNSFPSTSHRRSDWVDVYSGASASSPLTTASSSKKGQAQFTLPAVSSSSIAVSAGKGDCQICVTDDIYLKSMNCCQNTICQDCFNRHFDTNAKCPFCTKIVLQKDGDQPDGTMVHKVNLSEDLPGFPGDGTIKISYDFPDGIQTSCHPNPGQPYTGTSRRAYIPANWEGRGVLKLLEQAFQRRVLFTIGRSVTTGQDNCVVWNDIHQKTSKTGGAAKHGYPDSDYLRRVKEELAAKGIK